MGLCSGILEELTIDDVRALDPNVCVIPVGSTEPHGPALPYGTDNYRVESTCHAGTRRANELGGRVLCLPTVNVALNNNFRAFPFACRLNVSTFMAMLTDLVSMCEAEGVGRIVFVNGHGGNPDVIRAVQRDLAARDGAFVCLIHASQCASPEALSVWENRSDHAGEEETSQIMHLRPDLVRTDKITNNPQVQPSVEAVTKYKVDFVRPWHLYVPASAGGDARKASAEKGRTVIESSSEGMGHFLSELSRAPDSETFPY
jgi:creatinine amidohydrolase